MKKIFYISAFVFLNMIGFVFSSSAVFAAESETITLSKGWNTISTPRILQNHVFSANETAENFDIYTLNPEDITKWSTLADLGQAEFMPLYGYFINNKTDSEQTLTLNYKENLTPAERLFERQFNRIGWYLIGVSNPTYAKKVGSNSTDLNNPSKIIESIKSSYNNFIDFTDDSVNPDSKKVGNMKGVVPQDIASITDLRETKGYAVYINSLSERYVGFQNETTANDQTDEIGDLVISEYGSLPKTSVRTGEQSVVLERFNVSTGNNNGISISQVTVTRVNGLDNSVSNVILRRVGSSDVLAGPVSFNSGKAIFTLSEPITVTKGNPVNLEVVASINEASAGTSISYKVSEGDIVGKVTNSVINTVSTGSTNANSLMVGNEALTVIMSNSHPQGSSSYLISTTNRKDLAKFDVKATGGDVIMNTINLSFNGTANIDSTHYLSSVGLYDGDSLISDLKTVNTETANAFSLNFTVPAGTTKVLTVKGITNTLSVSGSASIITTWSSATGYGLASGETINSSTGIATTAVTVYPTGTATPSADTNKTPYSQAILAPSNDVTVAAIKIYAQREDMKLSTLKLHVTNGNDQVTSVRLFADDGVTALTDIIALDAATDTYTVNSDNIISDIVFSKGVYKTILVKANFNGTGSLTGVTFDVVGATTAFNGQDSGTSYNPSNLTLTISSPYAGGTYSSTTKVVTIQKNSGTPSGSISRGSQTVTGIWDVNNYDSTQADSVITAITFTSKTGLGSVDQAGTTSADLGLFKLYDQDGNQIAAATSVGANNVVVFSGISFTVKPGEAKQLKLVVDTTSTSKFASNTQLQFSVEAVDDVVVTNGALGYAAGVWTIPATVNVVQLP